MARFSQGSENPTPVRVDRDYNYIEVTSGLIGVAKNDPYEKMRLRLMAIIKELKGDMPVIGERAFLAETATIIGTVTMGDDCSIWYGAVLRGDVGAIRIGDRVNIQDNAVLHAT